MNALYFLTIPGLRRKDLGQMPNLSNLVSGGDQATLQHSFPSVTWPAQANMLTGKTPAEHGVVANGFYWRERQEIEMWTAWNEVIQQPQIWDTLKSLNPALKTAAWFPMLSKGCGADYVCMPAPIHKPDGSEDMWCYTKPQEFYGELLNLLGHFPLKHFWGPLAGIQSSQWIVDSAIRAAGTFQPDFFYIYLPHLDYAAQKFGPNSDQAMAALTELDNCIGSLQQGVLPTTDWLVASEYVISEVNHVTYPNRILRNNGLLQVTVQDDGEHIDFENSLAWALVDHQFSHVFVRQSDPQTIGSVQSIFQSIDGIASAVTGQQRSQFNLNHLRSGDCILVSQPNSWQAYYWWLDDQHAPGFARAVDIHRKPGYDPVELFIDRETMSIPLDATLVRGSHGVVGSNMTAGDEGVLLSSQNGMIAAQSTRDIDVYDLVFNRYR